MLKRHCLLFAAAAACCGPLLALDWVNTGELAGALHVNDLAIGPGSRLYAAVNTAADGKVFYSVDFTTWQPSGALPGTAVKSQAFAKTTSGDLLVGANGDYQSHVDAPLIHRSANGENWTFFSRVTGTRVGTTVTGLLVDDAARIHAAHNVPLGMSGAAPCYSTDQGATWTQASVPANPDGMGPFTQYCILQAQDNNIYVGAWNAGGRMLKSTDRGGSWQHTAGMYDAGHVLAAVEAPGGVLYAGTSPKNVPNEAIGRVFRSTNAGTNWVQMGYGYFSTTKWVRSLCLTSGGHLYAGTASKSGDAEVFVSTDDGATWSSAGKLAGATEIYRLLEVNVSDAVYLYAATGPNGDVFRADLGIVGVADWPAQAVGQSPAATIAKDILSVTGLPAGASATYSLLDAAGRRLMRLRPGENSVRHLAPGVYFVSPARLDCEPRRVVLLH